MSIDVHATKEAILALPQNEYKVLEEIEETKGVVLATSVDDGFTRTMIVINPTSIGIAIQSPDEKGFLTLLFKQLPVELISLLVTVDAQPEVVSESESEVEGIN